MKTITINLTTVRIDRMVIFPLPLRITVGYTVFDDQSQAYKEGEVTFWEVMPEGETNPNWAQLPTKYVLGLQGLAEDALTYVNSKEL
jgi:hypothetical protein